MKKLLILPLFLTLIGCQTIPQCEKNLPAVVVQTEVEYVVPEVNIPPSLLQPCADLQALPKTATFEDVLSNTAANTITYYDCKTNHKSLVLILEKSLDLKELK